MSKEGVPLLNPKSQDSTWSKFKDSFSQLYNSPRELWFILAINFFNFAGFGFLTFSFTIYLTEVLGFSDKNTGWVYSGFGISNGVYSVLFGSVPSRYGISKSLQIGSSLGILGYFIAVFSSNFYVQLGAIFVFVMLCLSINVPTTKLAVKKYTYQSNRSIAYSFYYLAFSVSGVIAGIVIDLIVNETGATLQTFQVIFGLGILMFTITLVLSLFLRELDLEEFGELEQKVYLEESAVQHIKEVVSLKSFWRYMALVVFLIVSKSLYFHLGATLPIYMFRTLGRGAHFGYMLAFHKVVLLFSMPAFTILVYLFRHYSLLVIGGVLSALSPLVMLWGDSYWTIAVFLALLGVGEAIWSPRLTDYTIEIAPKGKESTFLALASTPYSLSVILTGVLSGQLLAEYCPGTYSEDCYLVWVFISGVTLVSPIVMTAFRKCLEQDPDKAYESCVSEF